MGLLARHSPHPTHLSGWLRAWATGPRTRRPRTDGPGSVGWAVTTGTVTRWKGWPRRNTAYRVPGALLGCPHGQNKWALRWYAAAGPAYRARHHPHPIS